MLINQAEIKRESRKSIKIVIENNGNLVVFCPKNISIKKINEVLESKSKLITKKIEKIKKLNTLNSDIINYKSILLLGEKYSVIETNKVGKPYFTDSCLFLPLRYKENSSLRINILKKTLKNLASTILIKRLNDILLCKKINGVNKITVGSFKSKWGSCDSEGHIKLNWKVVMLPKELIDFIIFHEICHLKEMNHSRNFYNELSKFCPNHRQHRAILKSYSFLLNQF